MDKYLEVGLQFLSREGGFFVVVVAVLFFLWVKRFSLEIVSGVRACGNASMHADKCFSYKTALTRLGKDAEKKLSLNTGMFMCVF